MFTGIWPYRSADISGSFAWNYVNSLIRSAARKPDSQQVERLVEISKNISMLK